MPTADNVNGDHARPEMISIDPALLADVGHQLRNQLNAIVGAAGLLSATATSSDQRELASIVLVGSEELAGLIDEVLDSESIQSGSFELALHPFQIRSSVDACLARVGATAMSKGTTISFAVGDNVPEVIVGDSRRIELVLHSLLRLMAERTEGGVIQVDLSIEPGDGPLTLRFRIRTSGAALSQRVLEAGLSEAPTPSGLGPGERLAVLSLYASYRIIDMMDGQIVFRHAGENGATMNEFEFTFLAEAAADRDRTGETLAGMQVLVVLEDPTERRVLGMQAEVWGAPATPVGPDEAAATIASGRAFDVALVEHHPPAIDGLKIAAAIRSSRGPAELPIVLIAAGALGEEEVAAADSGLVQATLAKPVAPKKLHDVIAQVGRRRTIAPAVPAEVEASGVMLKILVADDNSLNQNMLRRQITKLGHQVDVVSNGREAVSAVEQHPYDALLMDVLMPEMDGLAAAAEICRRWSPSTRPRLIALTAMTGPGDEERCRKAGFDDYMSKPVHLDELAESLRAEAGWRAAPKVLS